MKYTIKRIDSIDLNFGVVLAESKGNVDDINKIFNTNISQCGIDDYSGSAGIGYTECNNGKKATCIFIILNSELGVDYTTIFHEISHAMDAILSHIYEQEDGKRCKMSSMESELKAGLCGSLGNIVFEFLNAIGVSIGSEPYTLGWTHKVEQGDMSFIDVDKINSESNKRPIENMIESF